MTTAEPSTLARTHHDHPPGVPGEVRDPVCGMTVDPATAEQRADHAGHQYFFCSARCRERFTADPDRYLTAPRASEMPAARSAAPRGGALDLPDAPANRAQGTRFLPDLRRGAGAPDAGGGRRRQSSSSAT